jgi:hypothetical protein
VHPHVHCCVCETRHRVGAIPATVEHRLKDKLWQCIDWMDCFQRARAAEWAAAHAEEMAALYQALADVWDSLEKEGWRI